MSVSRAQSSGVGVGDDAAVVSQVAGSVPRRRLPDTLPHCKPNSLKTIHISRYVPGGSFKIKIIQN